MIKKIVSSLLIALLLVSVTGCHKEEPTTTEKPVVEKVNVEYQEVTSPSTYDAISESIKYTTYYFDSERGNDQNDGLSQNKAKKTVEEANRIIAACVEETPTKILFKAGTKYTSTLKAVSFKAKAESPLQIGVYGATEEKPYAMISASPNCVDVSGSNIRISGLELTCPTADRGFYVYTTQSGAMSNVVIKGNYLHDLNFRWNDLSEGNRPEDVDYETVNGVDICPNNKYQYQYSAMYFMASTGKFPGASWFENVWVEDNTIERVSRAGIFVTSDWARRPGLGWGNNRYYSDEVGWYPHKNFNVLNNDISYTGGDAIVLIAVDGGFIQGNTSYHAQYLGRSGYYTAGIWCMSSKNIVFQYNEAAYTHLPVGTGDGQGFDIDIGNQNILFQYNYSHHNEGGGILLCNHPTDEIVYNEDGSFVQDEDGLPLVEKRHTDWKDVIIRNNVFADNGKTVFHIQGKIENLFIENNTMVIPGEAGDQGIVRSNEWGDTTVTAKDWYFDNNIFYLRNKRSSKFEIDFCPNAKFRNNVFYNFEDNFLTDKVINDSNCYTFNPKLEKAEAKQGIEYMANFIPKEAKCFSDGRFLNVMAQKDALGNIAKEKSYIGAFCDVQH